MNQHVAAESLARATALAPRKSRFHPRLEILDEVVAGFLWMQLDLPEDISRAELECFAHQLVSVVQRGGSEAEIAGKIAGLQHGQLCRPANVAAIHALARRAIMAVRGALARL